MKDSAIVCLESDAPHRAGDAGLRQTLIAALQGGDERPTRHHQPEIVYVERLRRAERSFDECGHLWRSFAQNRQRLDDEPLFAERIDTLLGPGNILKHAN